MIDTSSHKQLYIFLLVTTFTSFVAIASVANVAHTTILLSEMIGHAASIRGTIVAHIATLRCANITIAKVAIKTFAFVLAR